MLRIPFAINILILLPVCWTMATARDGGIAGGGIWTAILAGSIAGLALFAWPIYRTGG